MAERDKKLLRRVRGWTILRVGEEKYFQIISGEKGGALAGITRFFLLILSWVYGLGLGLRRLFYHLRIFKPGILPVKVASVGNITTGGTGKTPLVEYIARLLQDYGERPAILSRGYKGSSTNLNQSWSDEAEILRQNLPQVPFIIDEDRNRGGRRALDEYDASFLILDDGFQHWRLARNLEIVVVDALEPFGYGYLLPRGLLREPISALSRAELVVISRCDLVPQEKVASIRRRIRAISPGLPVIETRHRPIEFCDLKKRKCPVEWVKERGVFGFCGIGNARAFLLTLKKLKARVLGFRRFGDHHRYSPEELASLADEAKTLGAEALVTTQKDRANFPENVEVSLPILWLKIALEIISGKGTLEAKLAQLRLRWF